MGALAELHRRWADEDSRHRQVEAALRLVSGATVLSAVSGWGLLGTAPAVGIGVGLLAMEAARYLRDRSSPADIAAHIDKVAQTGWLMQTALSIEAGEAHGDPQMGALVLQQAQQKAPKLASAAVRPRRIPLPWLCVAGLALVSLTMRAPVVQQTLGIPGPVAYPEHDAEPDAPALAALSPERGRRSLTPDGAGVAGQSSDGARRSAAGGAGIGGGDASAGDGSAEGRATGSDASGGGDAGETQAGDREADRFEPPDKREKPEMPEIMGGLTAPRAGGGDEDGGRPPDGAPDGSGDRENSKGGFVEQDLNTEAASGGASSEAVTSSGATGLEDPQGEAAEEAAPAGDGMGTMNTDMELNITSEEQDRVWNPFTAGAGMGGLNDASATEDSIGGGGRDRYEMVDEWIDSRQRASAEGRVQTTEDGRSGGRSSVQYAEAYDAYEDLAEAAVAAEALPPGRRALIQRYFEAIRPEQNDENEEHSP